jgi:hypothetical protein
MSQLNSITKAGQITTEQSGGKVKFFAFNHERGKPLHIGSLVGVVYEKTAPILNKPVPSFCLPQSELAAIEQAGGQFIRFIARGAVGTYAISLDDFKLHGESYFNAGYGLQVRVPLAKFSSVPKTAKRNSITDNPAISQARPVIKPREKQMGLFG